MDGPVTLATTPMSHPPPVGRRGTAPDAAGPRPSRATFVRSAVVGLVSTAADVGALAWLVDGVGLSAADANAPALLLGVLLQYLGNKHAAFADHAPDHLRQGALFALVEAGALLWNAMGFNLLVTRTDLPFWIARPLVTFVVYVLFSYPLWARIFRPRAASC